MTTTATASDATGLSRHLREIAEAAAREVAGPLKTAFRGQMDIAYKADLHDPVTAYDRATETALRARLLEAMPGSEFLGEEGGASGAGEIRWIVDPIDGTANFASGLAFWCISIAAARGDDLLAGVVFDPMSGNLFAADDAGATLNGAPLQPRPPRSEPRAALLSGFPLARDLDGNREAETIADFAELLQAFSSVRRLGSAALTLCHVAAGWADAGLALPLNAWDVSAGALILRRAGGIYRPLRLGACAADTPAHFCPGYVASLGGADYPTLDRVASRIEARSRRQAQPA